MRFTFAITFTLAALPASAQSTWYVDAAATAPGSGTQAAPYVSIQYALVQPSTVHGDTIEVAPGTYIENIATNKRIRMVAAQGPTTTTIRPAGPGHTLTLLGDPTLVQGFTITGAEGPPGFGGDAAIDVRATVTIRDCILRDNVGWAVASAYDAILIHCTVVNNGAGVVAETFGGSASCYNSIVTANGIDLFDMPGSAGLGSSHCLVGVVDPGFWSHGDLDFHLRPGAVAIDAGSSFPFYNMVNDPDGSPPDAGALRYDAAYAPAPSAYCTAKVNSLGCVPAIGAVGSARVSGSPFVISCTNQLNNKLGLLFYGYAPKSVTYQGGWLCVQAPVQRTPLINSGGSVGIDDCSGIHAYDFDARIQSGVDPALQAGEMVYAQFWSRDPGASFTTVRSDAIRFGVGL